MRLRLLWVRRRARWMGEGLSPARYVSFPVWDCSKSLGFFALALRSVGPLFLRPRPGNSCCFCRERKVLEIPRGRRGRGRSSGASTRTGCERSAPLRPPGRRPRPRARWFGRRRAVPALLLLLFSGPSPFLYQRKGFCFFLSLAEDTEDTVHAPRLMRKGVLLLSLLSGSSQRGGR